MLNENKSQQIKVAVDYVNAFLKASEKSVGEGANNFLKFVEDIKDYQKCNTQDAFNTAVIWVSYIDDAFPSEKVNEQLPVHVVDSIDLSRKLAF